MVRRRRAIKTKSSRPLKIEERLTRLEDAVKDIRQALTAIQAQLDHAIAKAQRL